MLFVSLLLIFGVLLFIWMFREAISATSITWVHQGPRKKLEPLPMAQVSNPFHIELQNSRMASSQSIECILKSKVSCIVQSFWGAHINDLFSTLHKDWSVLKDYMIQDQLLDGSCFCRGDVVHEHACEKKLTFSPKLVVDAAVLGENLRQHYPFVLFIISSDTDERAQASVVGIAVIVHIKDELVKLDTHIMSQYLKLSNNEVCCLSKLYVASDSGTGLEERLCVVCQMEHVNVVLLPCRHLCTCRQCFEKLDSCPMCRSNILSYFFS